MILNRPAAVLFDLDGTLIDSAPDFYGVVNSLRQDEGSPLLADERIREQVSNGGIALACLTFEVTRDHPEIQTLRQRVLDRYLEVIGQASGLFPGFDQVIAHLNAAGIPWGIVTNKPRLYTDALLQHLQLQVPCVICPEDVSRPKPDPQGLLLAASQLALAPEHCWYVGDHIRDIEASRAAGMTAIAARFGYIEEHDSADNWPADIWIDSPLDLLTLLSGKQ